MGLDQYLFKINRASKDEKEFETNKRYSNICESMLPHIQEYIASGDKRKFIKNTFTQEAYDTYTGGQKKTAIEYMDHMIENTKNIAIDYMKDFVEGKITGLPETKEIMYWRKHHPLQDLLEDIYRDKGGTEEFNCVDVILTKGECESILEHALNELKRYDSIGYTDSDDAYYREKWQYTANRFKMLLNTVDFDKNTIYYHSWW